MPKLRLGINIDHVATLRNARKRNAEAHPDLLRAAKEAIAGGADSITFHLREDRRHILDDDFARLQKDITASLNMEMAATEEMQRIALAAKPQAVCLVPENRQEVTTEGGLDAHAEGNHLTPFVARLKAAGIQVALFIDPEARQVEAASHIGATAVELHTGAYAEATGMAKKEELARLHKAARQAHTLGLEVHAGHGLNYDNVGAIAAIPEIVELNIGHFLVGEAVFIGLAETVRKMRRIMDEARSFH
ncbi:MAG TPA: pyridoxine 5'-phosphate synthase [Alphaproteobacteria bacterium]|nr:pyridoxine 5'-phosphate synthase [Alphaproteobacteria bacterium]